MEMGDYVKTINIFDLVNDSKCQLQDFLVTGNIGFAIPKTPSDYDISCIEGVHCNPIDLIHCLPLDAIVFWVLEVRSSLIHTSL